MRQRAQAHCALIREFAVPVLACTLLNTQTFDLCVVRVCEESVRS